MSFKTEVINILGDSTGADASHVADSIVNATNAEQIVEDSLWDLANLLPSELLLNTAANLADGGATVNLDKETRVLLVERKDTVSNSLYYPCNEVAYHQHSKYIDDSSIYHATNFSPIWYKVGITSDSSQKYGQIKVYPSTNASTNIWLYEKMSVKKCGTAPTVDTPTADDYANWFWDGSADVFATLGDPAVTYYNYAAPHFFPKEAHLALKLLIASRLGNQYLVDFAINEEDGEVIGLVKAALDTIDVEFKMQIDRLGVTKDKESA